MKLQRIVFSDGFRRALSPGEESLLPPLIHAAIDFLSIGVAPRLKDLADDPLEYHAWLLAAKTLRGELPKPDDTPTEGNAEDQEAWRTAQAAAEVAHADLQARKQRE